MTGPAPEKAVLVNKARELGFEACGIARVSNWPHHDYFEQWLDQGRAGDMASWMGRSRETRKEPRRWFPDARSVIVLMMNYHQKEPRRRGRIAKYALGCDYHDLISRRLKELDRWLTEFGGEQRWAVDTSPLLEKPAAVAAGLGWQGKSTIFIHRRLGTWTFLAEVFTTLRLIPDPEEVDHCGSCRRCIDVCPTQAITGPYQLDARRCISYLTIEHKGPIPEEFRRSIGDHLFGCDDCLDVCPWNRWAQATPEPHLQQITRPDLVEMLDWSDEQFRRAFRGTPIFRLKRGRWLRNICVVLGNGGDLKDLPHLEKACQDSDALVQEHARWAVNEIRLRHPG